MGYNRLFVVIGFIRQRAPLRCKTANFEERRFNALGDGLGSLQFHP